MTESKSINIKITNLIIIVAILFTGIILTFLYIINLKNDKSGINKESIEKSHNLVYDKKLSEKAGSPIYTCSMHPQVISDHPGNCPICGMTLIKKKTNTVNLLNQKNDNKANINDISLSPSQQVMANVAVETVKSKLITKDINTVGKITYDETKLNHVSSWITGRINKLYLNFTGSEIIKGQKMLEIYSPDLVATQQEYLTAYESYLRLKGSSFKDIADSSLSLLDASRQKLLLWGIKDFQIKELQNNKKPQISVPIYAPSSGIIVKKNIQEGQYVNTGDILFDIADLSSVWLEADVYEYEMKTLNKGEKIEITSDTYPNKTFSGVITFISPSLDPMSKTIKVRAEFNNKNYQLKPEMTVNVKIHSVFGKSLVVPRTAVIINGQSSIVWLERKEGIYIPKEVKIGQPTDEYYPILSGLKFGDKVVVSGAFLLDSESQINTMSGNQSKEVSLDVPKNEMNKDLKSSPKDDMNMSDMKM